MLVVTLLDGSLWYPELDPERFRPKALGGPGSGNFGHGGRPGEVGGAAPVSVGAPGSPAPVSPVLSGLLDRIAQKDGGFTYQPVTGTEPTTGYVLSMHQSREKVLDAKELTLDHLVDFTIANQDLLVDAKNYLGGWHDPQSDKIFLDVSTVVKSAAEADALSREHNQKAYFDLSTGKSVNVLKAAHGQTKSPPRGVVGWTDGASYDCGSDPILSTRDWTPTVRRGNRPGTGAIGRRAPRALGGRGSGNFGHRGRPGEVGGSGESGAATPYTPNYPYVDSQRIPHEALPNRPFDDQIKIPPHADEAHLVDHLTLAKVRVADGKTIGGEHANPAWKVQTQDGDFLFKPIEGERHDINDSSMDSENGASLAEREVIASELAHELGFDDMIPEARMADLGEAPPPVPEKLAFPKEKIPGVAGPSELVLQPPGSVTPSPSHEGVIATTIGGLNAEQKLDAWGRPVWFGVKNANARGINDRPAEGNLVNPPATPKSKSSTTESSSRALPIGEQGALIKWIDGHGGYNSDSDGTPEERANLVVFDALIGNKDRHTANYMIHNEGGRLIGIDHGYAFPDTELTGDEHGGSIRNFVMNKFGGGVPDPGKEWADKTARKVESVDWTKFLNATPLSEGERQGVINRSRTVVKALKSPERLRKLLKTMSWSGAEQS